MCGGPQGMLQTMAWTGMLVSYSQDGDFTEAVEKTFDGAHPCPLCLAIEESRKAEHTPAPPLRPAPEELLKICLQPVPPDPCPAGLPAVAGEPSVFTDQPVPVHSQPRPGPPVPPPRAV